jgi:DNA repair photolyase
MAQWHKIQIKRENGEPVDAQAPIIVSASRSTDIPAFYADWFFHRLKVGYSAWTNPFNGVKSYVSYQNTRFIVFWSKNPRPLLDHLDYLKERNIGCYIQYTLNDYEKEKLEQGVPVLQQRIDTFKQLVDKLGKGRVVWRFDPLILTDDISIDSLLSKIEHIGDLLQGYTEKLVFSYADILSYRKVKTNLEKSHIPYHEWTEPQMLDFAERLAELNKKWGYILATCGEKVDLQQFGIEHNHCVDDNLMIRFAYDDKALMDFLKVKTFPIPVPNLFGESEPLPDDAIILPNNTYATHGDNRDKGQRLFCGCIVSKDIGEYNTCPHLCEYCYANATKQQAIDNWKRHQLHKESETITGK